MPAVVTTSLAGPERATSRAHGRRAVWRALAGPALCFFAIAALYAFQQPPFVAPDETAHVGYAQEIASGRLPAVTTEPAVPDTADEWAAERRSARDDRYRRVWVANHPPLFYALTAPGIWASRLVGAADGGLQFLRLANAAFGAVGVALTGVLGYELSGRRKRIGLLCAMTVAVLPQLHAVLSQGMNDGLAFAGSTAVLVTGVRCLRPAAGRPAVFALAASVCVAVGARAASMLLAGAVVGAVALHRAAVASGDWRSRARGGARFATVALLPGAVLFGWFYALNLVRYGDLAGSEFLLDTFARDPDGSVLRSALDAGLWAQLYGELLSSDTIEPQVPPFVGWVTALAAVGLVVAIARPRPPMAPADLARTRWAWATGAVAVVTVGLTVAQHVSGGGNAYARYLLPVVGVLACAVVVGLDRIHGVVAPAVVAVLTMWSLSEIPVGVDAAAVERPRDGPSGAPQLLRHLPGTDLVRLVLAFAAVVGLVLAAVAYARAAPRPVIASDGGGQAAAT